MGFKSEKGIYTTYCDMDGLKIYTGDTCLFLDKHSGAEWSGDIDLLDALIKSAYGG